MPLHNIISNGWVLGGATAVWRIATVVERRIRRGLGELVAVAEEFGDHRRWDLGDEVVQRAVAGAEQVNAQLAQSDDDGLDVGCLPGR